ncbi:MAG: twin-arginine translocase TatA/TatE family subunit [Nannocystis sp.]|jgi:sec-independent protein translocase protein TatA|nr:twin-arginine translocase TatA/TatE family subunit [Nannocystis sp.]
MLLAITLGGFEIVIIIALILLLFGPSKLPQLGEGVGKMLRGFRKEMKALEDEKAAEAEGKEAGEIDVTPAKAEERRPG